MKTNNISFTEKDAIAIKVISVNQPIGKFYVGVAKAEDVLSICTAKERKQDELEKYIGTQRPLNPERVEEIKKYVKTWDATFPNSVILSINPDFYFFKKDTIFIKRDKKSANIIDGQHRLAGFEEGEDSNFDIILTLFPDLEFEEQAYIFSVINTRMTRINPSLAQDLYELSTINTPEKLAHNIAKTFNSDSKSPWFRKIKMLGRKEPGTDAVLSQSRFAQEIIRLICDKKNSYEIRHILKMKKNKRSALRNFYNEKESKKYILWQSFVDGEDKFVFTILFNFFLAVKSTYPDEWSETSKILTKTTGYTALMNVFEVLCKAGFEQRNMTEGFFSRYFKTAKSSSEVADFNSANYPPGRVGEQKLTDSFLTGMGLRNADE